MGGKLPWLLSHKSKIGFILNGSQSSSLKNLKKKELRGDVKGRKKWGFDFDYTKQDGEHRPQDVLGERY